MTCPQLCTLSLLHRPWRDRLRLTTVCNRYERDDSGPEPQMIPFVMRCWRSSMKQSSSFQALFFIVLLGEFAAIVFVGLSVVLACFPLEPIIEVT